jgi:flagellar basal body P-ring formation protein FlgA
MHRSVCLTIVSAALACGPALARDFMPPAEIDGAVAHFLGAAAGTAGGAARQVDPRLKLARCEQELTVAWHGSAGKTLQVSCAGRGWRVFVPVNTQSRLGGQARETIVQRGETVSIVFEGMGFVLSRQGEALEAGAEGQWIKVRGQVISPATVRVSAAA